MSIIYRNVDIIKVSSNFLKKRGQYESQKFIKSLRGRHRDNRLIKRKGRLYVINKNNRRFKARQG